MILLLILKLQNFYTIIIRANKEVNPIVFLEILPGHKYESEKTALIGDSQNDSDAAENNDIEFIGYNNLSLRAEGCNYIEKFIKY